MELVGRQRVAAADREIEASRVGGRIARDVFARRFVYSGSALYAALFSATAAAHFYALEAARADLGTMAQAIWSTAHGRFLEVTTLSGSETTRLFAHVDPFLALLVPFWWAWPSPLMLLVFQAIAVSSGALPVFWLARKHLGSGRAGAHFAFAYLLFPATQFNALTIGSGFHALSLAVPLILYAIWFLDEERLIAFAVFALLAASTREEVPVAVGCLGLWYALRKGHRVAGGAIFAAGLAVTAVDFFVIIPHFSPTGVNPFAGRYADVGGTPSGILRTAVTDPTAFVHAVATTHKLVYVLFLLAPFLGLWILEPLVLLGAVPELAINLLSSKGDQANIALYPAGAVVPFVVAASILGASRLRVNRTRLVLYVLACVACLAVYSPVSGAILTHDPGVALYHSPDRTAKAHALALVPASAPVSATVGLGAYLSARRYIYIFPTIGRARWVVVDRNDPRYRDRAWLLQGLRKFERRAGWTRVYSVRGIEVWRKT